MLCTIDIRFFKTVCHLTTFALLLHLGEIEKYRIRWKLTTDSEWLEYKDVPPSAALCREEEAADLVCHTLTHLAQENYTIQVQAYNTGILQGSPWSAAAGYVIHGDEEEEEEKEGEEEESYLAPNPVRVASRESLDEEGYLRPNFNRFQRLDTTRPGSKHFKSKTCYLQYWKHLS